MSTLTAFVLFSVLASDLRPFRIPTMTARMTISPAEHTANDTLDIRFLSSDSVLLKQILCAILTKSMRQPH